MDRLVVLLCSSAHTNKQEQKTGHVHGTCYSLFVRV